MTGRSIATSEPTRCGCCRRPVELVRTVDHCALVEVADGRRVPHVCPDEAVEAWTRLDRVRRLFLGRAPAPIPPTEVRP